MNVRHSSKTNEQYTPLDLVGRFRKLCRGKIDLDPATTARVNEDIRARKFYTKADNGLKLPWGTPRHPKTVFVNPPGGLLGLRAAREWGTRSQQVAWWFKVMQELQLGHVDRAMFVSFSVELLQACQIQPTDWHPLDFAWCIPRQRIRFERIRRDQRIVGKQPSHSNILIFPGCFLSEVKQHFGDLGKCGVSR